MPYKCANCQSLLPTDHLLGMTVGTIPNSRVCNDSCAESWESSRPEKTEWTWKSVFQWVADFRRGRKDHPFYHQPDDGEIIWRYLDLPKLLDLLISRQLYLPAADKLGDPFEGSLSTPSLERFDAGLSKLEKKLEGEADVAGIMNAQRRGLLSLRQSNQWERLWTYVSCWHINAHESAAMWAAYGKRSDSVAIRSTVGRLRTCVEPHQQPPQGYPMIAEVMYRDYSRETVTVGYEAGTLLQKRKSFEHEHELRVLDRRLPHGGEPSSQGQHFDLDRIPIDGVRLDVDLNVLIEGLLVAPDAEPWFVNVVQSVTEMYGLRVKVEQATLLKGSPVF
jgi:hypothetical protein